MTTYYHADGEIVLDPETYELTAYAPGTRGTWPADIRKTYPDYYAGQAAYNQLAEQGYECYLVRSDRPGNA